MSTSGSVDFSVQAQEILTDALYLIGALEEGESITGEHTTAGLRALNMMTKAWQAHGLHGWTKTEAALFLIANQQSYTLPTAKCAKDTFGYTTLDGYHIATDTTLLVTNTAPGTPIQTLANGDNVGIELTDGTRYWTTVNGAPTSTGITLTAGLSGAASDGASIFWYTTGITKPSRLLGARRGQYDQAEVPLELVSRDIYTEQPSKSAASIPTIAHYAPQRTTGTLYVWPMSSSCNNVLWFTYERPLEDIDLVTNETDFPIEWQEALVWNLAWRLGPQYGAEAIAKAQALKSDALMMLDNMLQFDNDSDAIYFSAVMDIGIIGGAYESAVKPLAAQRCVNLFLEVAEAKAAAPVYLRRTPGLLLQLSSIGGAVRGQIKINGVHYAVCGTDLVQISSLFSVASVGTVLGTGPVSMAQNGVYIAIVNGAQGYTYNVVSSTFAEITDADFIASDIVLFNNGYFLFREVGTNNWFRSDVNDPTSFDASQIQSMSIPGYSRTGIVVQGEIFLLGEENSLVWVSGDNDFGFQLLQGSEMDRGCIAKFSPAMIDNTFYFLGNDRVVYRVDGYKPVRISHHAIEHYMGTLTLDECEAAVGFAYTQDGHYFYVLQIGEKTWVYDATSSGLLGQAAWHERSSSGTNWRVTSVLDVYGRQIGGDSGGNLWELSHTTYTEGDDLITWVRATAPVWNEDKFVQCSKLWLRMKVGVGSLTEEPTVELRTSDDGGFTWNDPKSRGMGLQGDYDIKVIWRRLGQFKNRIFEFSGSDDSDVAIIAGYMDG